MSKGKSILLCATLVVVFSFLSGMVLVRAKALLIPFTTAVIISLLVLPLSQKMESRSFNRAVASLLNTLFLLLISMGFLFLISFQVKNIMADWEEIRQKMKPRIEQLREFVMEQSPVSTAEMEIEQKDLPLLAENTGTAKKEDAADFFFLYLISRPTT